MDRRLHACVRQSASVVRHFLRTRATRPSEIRRAYDRIVEEAEDEERSDAHRPLEDFSFVRQGDIVSVVGPSGGLKFSIVQHVTRDDNLRPVRVHTADKRVFRVVYVAQCTELQQVGCRRRGVVWRTREGGGCQRL